MKKEILQRISKSRDSCINCEMPLDAEHAHPAVICAVNGADFTDAQPEEILREDYCSDCWKTLKAKKQVLARWMAKQVRQKPSKARTRMERADVLCKWFDYLQTQPESLENDQFLYVIAHLLMKYKVLQWQTSDPLPDTPEIPRFISFKTKDATVISIRVVPLSSEVNQKIVGQIERFFNGIEALPVPIPTDERANGE